MAPVAPTSRWAPHVASAFDAAVGPSERVTVQPPRDPQLRAANVDGVFVISMGGERLVEAQRTLEQMQLRNDYTVWPAVVGKTIVDPETGDVGERFRPLFSSRAMTSLKRGRDTAKDLNNAGAAGCSLSHIGIWKYMVDKNLAAALIFEDDVAPVDAQLGTADIARVIQDAGGTDAFDILWLYHAALVGHGKEQTAEWSTSSDVKRTWGPGWCTLAYVLTQRGARALLETALPLASTIDTYVYDVAAVRPDDFIMLRTRKNLFKHSIANSSIGYNLHDLLTSVSSKSYTYAAAGLALALLVMIVTIVALVLANRRKCPPCSSRPPAHPTTKLRLSSNLSRAYSS